ncbi:MAG: single-stranded-DNA-specific exonuclease RecJ [Firmicutes bacterium]|nr:single-stranded-DNA-specific exonuclease RecJ [Bacillota bacterium]
MQHEHQQAVWRIKERKREAARQMAQQLDLHPVVVEVLMQRGITEIGAMQRFLHPDLSHLHDPLSLPDMVEAVDRIRIAEEQGQLIAIYGDYDADGLTATALLVDYLRHRGNQVTYYIPDRLDEGYGLHGEAIEELASRGVQLLITVDCGINSRGEVALANQLGMDVIITDHHTPDIAELPDAVAVINPKLPHSEYPFVELAGVGLALKLVQALGGIAAAASYLDLAALGTVADVVPLVDENRVIVRFGLEAMGESRRPGLRALLAVAGIDSASPTAGQVAFMLAPRLNAAGRLNEADLALELLLTEDESRAEELAASLSQFNSQRQSIEQAITEEAEAMVSLLEPEQRWFIVLAKAGWHPGVIGIVASRLAERHHRPVILLTLEEDQARGSGRSIPGYDLIAALHAHSHLLSSYGGHKAAAGLSLSQANIEPLAEALNRHVQATLEPAQLRPTILLDAELDPSELTLDLVRSLEKLEPFGAANPEPVFCSKRWRVEAARLIGQEGQHLKIDLQGGGLPWEGLAWRRGQDLDAVRQADWLDVAYTPRSNLWNGRESVVLHLRSWCPPAEEGEIAIYDARFLADRDAYLEALLREGHTVLVCFWPAFCRETWPRLQQRLDLASLFWQPGPIYFQARQGKWQTVPAQELVMPCELVWLDAPLGLSSLERLAEDLGDTLYHHRIHLLYNGNDADRAYKLLEMHGPNRAALAALYRGLKRNERQQFWYWEELCQIMRSRGYLGLPDQISLHLQVMQDLALAECACTRDGARVNWLPHGSERRDLNSSPTFVAATAELAAFATALEDLRGPDAGNIISRSLRRLLSS